MTECDRGTIVKGMNTCGGAGRTPQEEANEPSPWNSIPFRCWLRWRMHGAPHTGGVRSTYGRETRWSGGAMSNGDEGEMLRFSCWAVHPRKSSRPNVRTGSCAERGARELDDERGNHGMTQGHKCRGPCTQSDRGCPRCLSAR